jgi:hypothetical protein
MAEKARVYVGATELTLVDGKITKTNDTIVNEAELVIKENSNVEDATVLDIRQSDGSTSVISGKVFNIKKPNIWKLQVLTNGYELLTTPIDKQYISTTPEDIVQDIVDNFTNTLTFASSTTSGITVNVYNARGYLIDVIRDMANALKWQVRIDASDNVYFEPKGNIDNNVTLQEGVNFTIEDWEDDGLEKLNSIRVRGGFENIKTTETVTGTGTKFILSHKPSGTFTATVSGSEVDPGDYTVDVEGQEVTFDLSQTDPTFEYSYNRPIDVIYKDDDAISEVGYEIYKKVEADWINNETDALNYGRGIINSSNTSQISAVGYITDLDWDMNEGEIVRIYDPLRGRDEALVITKIEYQLGQNRTKIYAGSRPTVTGDWQAEAQRRIFKLENRPVNEDRPTIVRLKKSNMLVSLTTTPKILVSHPVDSFILGHRTLGRLRPNLNYEADCSDNGNHGTWLGSGIDGDQYGKGSLVINYPLNWNAYDRSYYLNDGVETNITYNSGKIGRGAVFNGTSSIITAPNTTEMNSNDFSVAFWFKADTNRTQGFMRKGAFGFVGDGWRFFMAGTNGTVEFDGAGEVGNIQTGATTAGTWYHVVGTYSHSNNRMRIYLNGVLEQTANSVTIYNNNTSNLIIARPENNRLDGMMDDLRYYNQEITQAEIDNIYNSGDGTEDNLSVVRNCYAILNGSDRYIASGKTPADLGIGGANSRTVCCWFKINNYVSESGVWEMGTESDSQEFTLRQLNSNNATFRFQGWNDDIDFTLSTSAADDWVHIAVTYDGTTVKIYENSVLIASENKTLNTTNTKNLSVGKYRGNYLDGYIDEFLVYTRALSSDELSQIMNNNINTSQCVVWYSMDNPRLGDRQTTPA